MGGAGFGLGKQFVPEPKRDGFDAKLHTFSVSCSLPWSDSGQSLNRKKKEKRKREKRKIVIVEFVSCSI